MPHDPVCRVRIPLLDREYSKRWSGRFGYSSGPLFVEYRVRPSLHFIEQLSKRRCDLSRSSGPRSLGHSRTILSSGHRCNLATNLQRNPLRPVRENLNIVPVLKGLDSASRNAMMTLFAGKRLASITSHVRARGESQI